MKWHLVAEEFPNRIRRATRQNVSHLNVVIPGEEIKLCCLWVLAKGAGGGGGRGRSCCYCHFIVKQTHTMHVYSEYLWKPVLHRFGVISVIHWPFAALDKR